MSVNPQHLMRAFVAARGRLADSLSSERGAGLAEYALLLFLLAIVVAVVIPDLANAIVNAFNDATAALGG
ncbi:MAG: Flp family type IVb pilin [Actinomycetia bacterium]|nr:Flp family type IVb pilin [Actinomycetes bacterium]